MAGCATGEEAYSVAMLCADHLEESKKTVDVKIFATDLDKEALDFAGRGVYPESIVVDLPDEKLRRYFLKEGNSYYIQRHIRQMVVFAAHNILSDPPFAKISLVTCRNLLIYLQPVLQQRVLTSFGFALYPRGYLFLGSSETIGDLSGTFETASLRHKIFRHRGESKPGLSEGVELLPLQERMTRRVADQLLPFRQGRGPSREQSLDRITEKLLREHLPACLVIEESGQLIYTYGTPGDFLALPAGQATLNAFEMLPRALALVLSSAIHKAHKDNKALTYRGIRIRDRSRLRSIDMTVEPFRDDNGSGMLYLVFLSDPPWRRRRPPKGNPWIWTTRFPSASTTWSANCKSAGKTSRRPSRNSKPRTRNSRPPTKSCWPRTKNFRAPTRNCNRSTRNCIPSTRNIRAKSTRWLS
ncbi:MAG: CheR family methyltransferase [Candidatus Competibacter sp.]